jgi:hypothetical protein
MIRMGWIGVVLTLVFVSGASPSWSQERRDEALKRDVERRFDVLPLRDGLALHPKTPIAGVRSVEIAGGAIAIDGQSATGAELRSRLGAAADAVIELSYLTDDARQRLFSDQPAPPAAPPALPAPVPAPVTPEFTAPPLPERPFVPLPRIARRMRDRDRDRGNGDRVRIGGGVTVDEGEVVDGNVVAVGGSAQVNGTVKGDVVAVGGGVTLGPHASVERNVTVVGGRLTRDAAAIVGGKASEIGLGSIDFGKWTWQRNPVGFWWGSMLGSAFAFVGTLARVGMLCLCAALVVLLGRESMDRAGSVAATESLKAGAVGVLAQILFLPLLAVTIIVLVMTIIGIPLLLVLPLVLLALAIVGLVGFSAVASRVGGLVAHRFGWTTTDPYTLTIVGVILLMLPIILSRLAALGGAVMFPMTMVFGIAGGVIEYLAWTIGFGAMAIARVRRRYDSQAGTPSPAV